MIHKYKAMIISIKLAFAILPIAYLCGFIIFIKNLPKQLENYQKDNEKIDAIVVLTGGQFRIQEGLNMLKNRKAKLLFISGLFTDLSFKNYKKILGNFRQIRYNNIHYDVIAKTTIENAQQVKNWVNKNKIKSIYLVTSYYHIPRAKYLIRHYIPNLKIIINPVFPINFDMDRNIYNIRIFSLIFFEYNKYILSNVLMWFINIF